MATGGGSSSALSTAISEDQFAQLMGAINASRQSIDDKFTEFRAEMKQGQEDAAAKGLKRVRHDKPYTFKRKGNEEQAGFNEKVEEAMAEAQAELADVRSSPALERAQEALSQGMKLLAERQKLIKIADRSEYGWGVVVEYTADEEPVRPWARALDPRNPHNLAYGICTQAINSGPSTPTTCGALLCLR